MGMTRDDIQGGLVKGAYAAAPTKPKPKPLVPPSTYGFIGGPPGGSVPAAGGNTIGEDTTGWKPNLPTTTYTSVPDAQVPNINPFAPGGSYGGGSTGNEFPNIGGTGTITVDTGASGAQTPAMDPQVLINQLLERMGIGSIDKQLQADREKALIAWGDPALASQAGFGMDPQAGVFAQQNYLSGNAGLARLDKNRDLAKKAVINRLAAKGTLRSGDLGYLNQQEDQNYGNQRYDATQQLLTYLTQVAQQAQERKNALRQSVINSVMQAYQNYAQNPQAYMSLFGG